MKLIERTAGVRVFSLTGREKTLFERLLSFYPLRPDAAARLSREPVEGLAEAEVLLQEALRDQKAELAGWVEMRFAEGEMLRSVGKGGWHLSVTSEDSERLLQVLNELRVGAWTKLGCPEDIDARSLAQAKGSVPLLDIMMLAGHFQSHLLDDIDGSGAEPSGEG